ncbi:hypothetical protein A0H81_02496 [Grifola frondosa]|uniref:Uncharacterized protein n=1 Tax=Grifola frondosa TaxID=5627 RepID=A0A1C7MKY0_GRIFR|nr:hypothetical protein A0H81_02496 [Grifola frondosa]
MPKRPRDIFDTPGSSSSPLPTSKRARFLSTAPLKSSSSISTPASTPYSYLRTPFSIPSDSPTNPFGLKRALLALTLPRETGFGKHLALRFQLVETTSGSKGKGKARDHEDIFRIVQVPKNYSFRLLHMLVLFLFAADARLHERRRTIRSKTASGRLGPLRVVGGPSKPTTRKVDTKGNDKAARSSRIPGSSAPSSNSTSQKNNAGHVFDVYKNVELYSNSYKPGVVKTKASKSTLYARLSSVRERRLFPDIYEQSNDGSGGDEETEGEDEDDGWTWEAEDDFTLSHVWVDGPDLKKGIIYVCLLSRLIRFSRLTLLQHHTPTTEIHITINQTRLPPRKGIGNKPFVFRAHNHAHGAVRASNLASTHASIRETCEQGPDDQDGEYDAKHLMLWNAYNAFTEFLERETERERALRRPLISRESSPAAPSSSPTRTRRGSPFPLLFSPDSSPVALSNVSLQPDAYTLPLQTPFPKHPAHRRRVARALRRLEKLTQSGLAEMSGSEAEEVDELADDGAEEEEVGADGDWDPFGDEAEL